MNEILGMGLIWFLGFGIGWLVGKRGAWAEYASDLDELRQESDDIRAEWDEFHEDFQKAWKRYQSLSENANGNCFFWERLRSFC